MTGFRNQIALVTGAGSGIGRAIALALAERGAGLVLVARRLETLEAVAASASCTPGSCRCHAMDLSRDPAVEDLCRTIERDPGRLDILVHAAGVFRAGSLEQALPEEFDEQYRLNLRAPYLLTRGVLPLLKLSRGQIVFVNSTAGLDARATVSQYAATKHALKALADSVREELNPHGVRVLSVYAGRTATPMQERVHEYEHRPYRPETLLQPEDVASVVVSALGLPPTAEVTDIRIRPMIKPA